MGYDSDEESAIEHELDEETGMDQGGDESSEEESAIGEQSSSPSLSKENIPPQFQHGLPPGYALNGQQLLQQMGVHINSNVPIQFVHHGIPVPHHPLLPHPQYNPSKRPTSSEDLNPSKRHLSLGTAAQIREQQALQEKIFGDKARDVEDFDTFTSQEDALREREEENVKVPKAELEWLIQSIPLEDRAKGNGDISETVMAFHAAQCPLILGDGVP
jgi:hypothetical protein